MRRRILLTGGAGYIGSHTCCALVAAGFDVVIVDDFSNAARDVPERLGRIVDRAEAIRVYEGSVLDASLLDRIFAETEVDAVIHFAARKAVGESVRLPIAYAETNVSGLITLLGRMEAAGVHRMVFSSSATVYGDAETIPTPEDAPLGYENPYGFTKLAGEQLLAQVGASGPWAFGILRYFNPAGAHPSGLIGEDPTDIPNNLVPYVAKVALGELPHLNVFGDDYPTRDGTGERDYIHVEDLAHAHVLSVQALLRTGRGHLVNVGTGRSTSVLELLTAYGDACGRALPYVIAPRRPGDAPRSLAEVSLAKEVLGFVAARDLRDMCASSWAWVSKRAGAG